MQQHDFPRCYAAPSTLAAEVDRSAGSPSPPDYHRLPQPVASLRRQPPSYHSHYRQDVVPGTARRHHETAFAAGEPTYMPYMPYSNATTTVGEGPPCTIALGRDRWRREPHNYPLVRWLQQVAALTVRANSNRDYTFDTTPGAAAVDTFHRYQAAADEIYCDAALLWSAFSPRNLVISSPVRAAAEHLNVAAEAWQPVSTASVAASEAALVATPPHGIPQHRAAPTPPGLAAVPSTAASSEAAKTTTRSSSGDDLPHRDAAAPSKSTDSCPDNACDGGLTSAASPSVLPRPFDFDADCDFCIVAPSSLCAAAPPKLRQPASLPSLNPESDLYDVAFLSTLPVEPLRGPLTVEAKVRVVAGSLQPQTSSATSIPVAWARRLVSKPQGRPEMSFDVALPSAVNNVSQTPHARIGGYCAETHFASLCVAIFALTGVHVESIQLFRPIHGLVTVRFRNPERDFPLVVAALDHKAVMTRDGIFVARTGGSDPLEVFALALPKGCRQPRRLMTVDRWKCDLSEIKSVAALPAPLSKPSPSGIPQVATPPLSTVQHAAAKVQARAPQATTNAAVPTARQPVVLRFSVRNIAPCARRVEKATGKAGANPKRSSAN